MKIENRSEAYCACGATMYRESNGQWRGPIAGQDAPLKDSQVARHDGPRVKGRHAEGHHLRGGRTP